MPNGIQNNNSLNNQEIKEDIDLHFEVRSECLQSPLENTTTDTQPKS